MTAPLLVVEDRRISFEGARGARNEVVHGIGFSLSPGDRLALIGESGSGKTLTALSTLRLLPPRASASGRVLYRGEDIDRLDEAALRQLRGGQFGVVFQDALVSFNPVRTVGALLVESACRHSGLGVRAARERAVGLLDDLGVPSPRERLAAYPHQLSGGLRQRCMIALALINDPAVLIADEPTSALDATIQAQILELLERRSEGKALLFITHDLAAAARLCEQAVLMRAGRVEEAGRLDDLLRDPQTAYGRALVGASPALVRHPPGGAASPGAPPAAPSQRPTLTVVRAVDLERSFVARGRILRALRGVSLDVTADRVCAIVGESGCGKSTLAKALVGLVMPDGGGIHLDDARIGDDASRLRELRRRVQFVFQDPYSSLDPTWSVGDIVAEPLRASGVAADEATRRANTMLDAVGIEEAARGRLPRAFSGGQRQRIAIARALVTAPQVLVADEPLSALDVTVQAQIVELLRQLRTQLSLGLVIVSHDLAMMQRFADSVHVMYLGRIVEEGPAVAVLSSPAHPYTAALVAAAHGEPTVRGEVPSAFDPPPGCAFAGRCARRLDRCRRDDPSLALRTGAAPAPAPGHRVACWNPLP
jgi:oligopeptide/dipeptide ABC transporter ATP-binding protein